MREPSSQKNCSKSSSRLRSDASATEPGEAMIAGDQYEHFRLRLTGRDRRQCGSFSKVPMCKKLSESRNWLHFHVKARSAPFVLSGASTLAPMTVSSSVLMAQSL